MNFYDAGDVAIALTDDKGKDVPCNTIDNKDGTFTVEYEPKTPGMYTVQVYFATKEVPQSPIKVKVESSIDLSKVTVKGLETRKLISLCCYDAQLCLSINETSCFHNNVLHFVRIYKKNETLICVRKFFQGTETEVCTFD